MLILIVLIIVVAATGYATYWLTRPATLNILFKKGVSGEDALITITKYGGGNVISRMAPDPQAKAVELVVSRIHGFILLRELKNEPKVQWFLLEY